MKKLLSADGSWAELTKQWSAQCHKFDEDFASYIPDTISLLQDLVDQTVNKATDGVFAFVQEDIYQGICFVNGAFIPGFAERVLRVRHVILAPENDFGEFDEEKYARRLGSFFEAILAVSDSVIHCKHVKIHFRSPADVAIFQKFSANLSQFEQFSSVQMKGAWLMITKC